MRDVLFCSNSQAVFLGVIDQIRRTHSVDQHLNGVGARAELLKDIRFNFELFSQLGSQKKKSFCQLKLSHSFSMQTAGEFIAFEICSEMIHQIKSYWRSVVDAISVLNRPNVAVANRCHRKVKSGIGPENDICHCSVISIPKNL